MFCFLLLLCFWNPVRSSRASALLYGALRFDPSLSVLISQKGLSQDPPSFFPFPCAATCACGSLSVAAGERVFPRPLVPAFRFSYYLHGQPPTDRQRKIEVHDNQCNAACLLASASFLAFWLLLHAKPPSPLVSSHCSICQAERSFASSRSIST